MAGNDERDALAYIQTVKYTFHDRRDKYDEFLKIMNDFKAQRLDAYGTVERVKNLFEGQPDLIQGFNRFMPDELKIVVAAENGEHPVKKPIVLPDAICFVNKVKTRFQGEGEHVYRCFLDILGRFRAENQLPAEPKAYEEAYEQVAFLFGDQRDLLEEFTRFLPKGHWTSPRLVDELSHLLSKLSTAVDLQENGDK